MSKPDVSASDFGQAVVAETSKEQIRLMLEKFTREHNLKSLDDRLRIGLNEVGILAVESTNRLVREMCQAIAGPEGDGEEVFEDLLEMCVIIQQRGPWGHASILTNPDSSLAKAWFCLNTAVTFGYEKEKDLNDEDFFQNQERIRSELQDAISASEKFFAKAKKHVLKRASKAIKQKVWVPPTNSKPGEWKTLTDSEIKKGAKGTPWGEGLGTFLPMAIEKYHAGVATDAEGWVYVGAAERIKDKLLLSCGLTKEVIPDPRDPKRTVDMYSNFSGQQVVKRVHPGFLVVLNRSLDLALLIASAINDEAKILEVGEGVVEPTRVIQTTEAKRGEWNDDAVDYDRRAFLKMPELRVIQEGTSESLVISRPKDDFYKGMLYIRGLFVYLDRLKGARHKLGRELTDYEKETVMEDNWRKMEQKVDELRYLNGLIDEFVDDIPSGVDSIIDMAGGAGDFGLAVGTEFLSRGRQLKSVEIVDPQKGLNEFMEKIVSWIPFRKEFEEKAHLITGFLQAAEIRPETMVVAKHACGTLSDDIIEMWRESESPLLVAMTCCQDKAAKHPARYGLNQDKWIKLCLDSAKTNTEIPEEPGQTRDLALRELVQGQKAMDELDLARVEDLRRRGFAAELRKTDKFPKGNVIIARRLSHDFMGKISELQRLEKSDPIAFDNLLSRLDKRVRGRKVKADAEFGFDGWSRKDFAELIRRLEPATKARAETVALARMKEAAEKLTEIDQQEEAEAQAVAEAARKKAEQRLTEEVFADTKGRIDLYLDAHSVPKKKFREIIPALQIIIKEGGTAESVRRKVDVKMAELGYEKK